MWSPLIPTIVGMQSWGLYQTKMRNVVALLHLLLWEVKGGCQWTPKKHIQRLAPALLWDEEMAGEEKKETVSRLISASVPCVCQSNILKQHMQGSATANYPALGMGNEKTSWRTMKRTWLGERASVSADRLLFLMNIQHLNGPSRGLPLNIAPLFTALMLYVTTKYPPMRWLLDTRKGKRYIATI